VWTAASLRVGTWSADRVRAEAEQGKIESGTVGEEGMAGVFTGGIIHRAIASRLELVARDEMLG
jgi:hypothetical protein